MRPVGDLVPAVLGQDPQPEPRAERRVARLQRDGAEVRLPAITPALPRLSRALAARASHEAAAEPPAPNRVEVNERGERVVVEPAPLLPPTPVSADMKREAAEPLARLRRMLEVMAPEEAIEAWVRRACRAVRNPPAPEDGRRRIAAIVEAVADVPAMAFTDESAREALRRWEWFPSGADVHRYLEEVLAPFRAMLRGLEAVERAPIGTGPARERRPEADPPAARSPEEVAAVHAKRDAFLAEIRAREAADRARRPAPVAARPCSPAELTAACEALAERARSPEARAALLFRARTLRQQHPEVAS